MKQKLVTTQKVVHHTVLLLVNNQFSTFKYADMKDSNYKNYSDLTLDELEEVVVELENLSIKALKEKKKSLRNRILHSVTEAIKEIEKRLKK